MGMVSDARIELAPHAPKARMIPFHQSEKTINTVMNDVYETLTPNGLHIYLCRNHNGVCIVILRDVYDQKFMMKYFTDYKLAFQFILDFEHPI